MRRKLNIDHGSLGFTIVVVSDASLVVGGASLVVVVVGEVGDSVVVVVVVVDVVVVVVVVETVVGCKTLEANCSGPKKKFNLAKSDFFIGVVSDAFVGVRVGVFRRLFGVMTMLFLRSIVVGDRMLLTADK